MKTMTTTITYENRQERAAVRRRLSSVYLSTEKFALVATVLALSLGLGLFVQAQDVDWSPWEELPVFHNGRVMPLISFAEETVELICGRANPVLSPDSTDASTAPLFPEGKGRRFSASELIFSWIAAPDLWQDVPFLFAGHEELRSLLGLPLRDSQGRRLRFASPRAVEQSVRFHEELRQISEKVRAAEAQGLKPRLTATQEACQRLYRAYQLFRMISFRAGSRTEVGENFWDAMVGASEAFRRLRSGIAELGQQFAQRPEPQEIADLEKQLSNLQQLFQQVMELGGKDTVLTTDCESLVASLRNVADQMEERSLRLREMFFSGSSPGDLKPEVLAAVRAQMNRLTSDASRLRWQLREAHLALFETRYALRVVPAPEPRLLEAGARVDEDTPVWLALSTVLDGSPALLEKLAEADLQAVRQSFAAAAEAYRRGLPWTDPKAFSADLHRLGEALRQLGFSANRLRLQLASSLVDKELERATRYPEPRDLRAEITYHRVQPFLWAWVMGGLALVGFGLSFGWLRCVAFLAGLLALLAAAVFIGYGLALRALITGYTPVTNMFETVVFVALVSAVLGVWMTTWPWFGRALGFAWRLTAVPGTFEATPLGEAELAIASEGTWRRAGWYLAGFRAILAVIIIWLMTNIRSGAKGGEPVFTLVPGGGDGTAITLNDWVVWLVGISVVLVAAWLVPRIILSLVVTGILLPRSLRQTSADVRWREALDRRVIGAVSAAVTLLAALVAYLAPISGKRIAPLMPVLRDNFWLTLHVLTITASYGAGALVWGLANLSLAHFLFGRYRPGVVSSGQQSSTNAGSGLRRQPPEACIWLTHYMYRGMQVAVVLLAAGTIFGGLWADVSWGRFWGWDSKEVWALIALLVYLGVLHGRLVGMLNEFGLAVGAIFGATAIVVAWYGVNFVFGSGLHSYGEGTGGGAYMATALVLNWLFVGAAWLRYRAEMGSPVDATLDRTVDQPVAEAGN